MHRVAVGGTVHVFAGTPGSAPVDANVVHYRHVRLAGSTGSRRKDYETARDLVASGEIKLGRIPHEVIQLDDAPAAVLARPPDAILKTIVAVN
jgi:threonine dehydrogenase-like Zn-dependent dehydrogenase